MIVESACLSDCNSSIQDASTNFIRKMALHASKYSYVILDMWVKPSKDISIGKTFKKGILVWKFLVLVLIGLCGISMCLMQLNKRNYLRENYVTMHGQTSTTELFCHRKLLETTYGFRYHHPHPKTYKRRECACTPVHYFVILSMQRSGSGWFETLLNSHPNINSHGEIFSVGQRHENFSIIANTLDKVYNLDWISSAAKNECTSAVGFKWMLNQGVMEYNREILRYFETEGVSVIFLFRRNTLRRLISILANAYDRSMKQLNGTHKSHVHSEEEAGTLAVYKPTINVTFLHENLQRIQEFIQDALLRFNSTRHITVHYEDLVGDRKKMVDIQQFLGLSVQNLESQQVKIHTRPLSQQIQNWDAVYKKLKGTEFEGLLEEKQ